MMQRFSMFWSLEVSGKVLDCKFGWVGDAEIFNVLVFGGLR